MKFAHILTIIMFCVSAAPNTATAQTADTGTEVVPSDSSGEVSSREIDLMAVEAKQTGARLYVIVRSGTGERSRRVNAGRLSSTRTFLSYKGFERAETVYAVGESVKGEGRIEFYLGSSLRLVLLAGRNKMPNLTCCEDYMPPAERRGAPRGNRKRR